MPDNKIEESGDIIIDISQEDRDLLVMSYVDRYFLDVSKVMFGTVLKQTGNLKEALFDATLNEVANIALREKMNADLASKQENFTNDE